MSANWRLTLVSAVSLSFFILGIVLGQWQLGRAARTEAMAAERLQASQLPPLNNQTLAEAMRSGLPLYRQARLSGNWLAEQTVYLDNRKMGTQVGLIVTTPFKLQEQDKVILVQRGWVARNFLDRSQVPALATASGVIDVTGQITPWPSRLLDLGEVEQGSIRQNLDPGVLPGDAQWLGVALSLQQSGPSDEGLRREWVLPGTGVDKHYGYAFQWFTLSALVALYYFWFQIVKRFRRPAT